MLKKYCWILYSSFVWKCIYQSLHFHTSISKNMSKRNNRMIDEMYSIDNENNKKMNPCPCGNVFSI